MFCRNFSVLVGHKSSVTCLEFLNKCLLLSGDESGIVFKWDLETNRPVFIFKYFNSSVIQIKSVNEDQFLVQGREEGMIKFVKHKEDLICSVPFSKYSFCRFDYFDKLLISLNSETVDIYELITESNLFNKKGGVEYGKDNGMVLSLKILPLSKFAVGFEDGSLFLYKDFCLVRKILKVQDSSPILSISFFKNLIFTAGSEKTIVIVDSRNYKKKELEIKNKGINQIINDKKRIFLTAGWDNKIRIFDMKSPFKPLTILNVGENIRHSDSINSLDIICLKQKFTWLVSSASKDNKIVIWNLHIQKKK